MSTSDPFEVAVNVDGSLDLHLKEIRPIRDEIDRRVRGLLAELVDPASSAAR